MSAQRALAAAPLEAEQHAQPATAVPIDSSPPDQIDTALDRDQSEEPTVLADEAEAGHRQGSEQAITEETEETTADDANIVAADVSQAERAAAAARIRGSNVLPPALRERIAVLVETSGDAAADGAARVPLDGIVTAVEASLPAFLRGRGTYDRTEHPGGDAFFHAGEPLSDDAAERIAHTQLSNSGLLRGQRVRVAED